MNYTRLKARRWLLRRKRLPSLFDEFLRAELPARSASFDETEFVSLDIGWVFIRQGKIDLRTAQTFIVRPSGDVGTSASVHGLTDTVVGSGLDWNVVLDEIVRVLTGRVLLVHHAGLDKTLLDRMCVRRFGHRLPAPVVDTLALEHRRNKRNHHLETNASLRLSDLRDEYGLPRYAAHDCLVDAIATAELLLAIVARRRSTALGDLLT